MSVSRRTVLSRRVALASVLLVTLAAVSRPENLPSANSPSEVQPRNVLAAAKPQSGHERPEDVFVSAPTTAVPYVAAPKAAVPELPGSYRSTGLAPMAEKPAAAPAPGPAVVPATGQVVPLAPSPVAPPAPSPVAAAAPVPVATPAPSPVGPPAPSPVAPPVPSPVATPVPSPVAPPVPSPVAPPVPSPVATPAPGPVATPAPSPVGPPVPSPVATPVSSPVATPGGGAGNPQHPGGLLPGQPPPPPLPVIGVDGEPGGGRGSTTSAAVTFTISAGAFTNQANPVIEVDRSPISIGNGAVAVPLGSWLAADGRGSGAGWNVTITATEFSASGNTLSIAGIKVALAQADIVTLGGNGGPITGAATAVPLSRKTPFKLIHAAGLSGAGRFSYSPSLVLAALPGGGTYSASIIVSINSGP